MICGLGIDSVEIQRFNEWHAYSNAQLSKFFSPQEITYCRSVPAKMAERCAARFAAKEAFLKALSHLEPIKPLTLLSIAQVTCITTNNAGAPTLLVDWPTLLQTYFPHINIPYQSMLSLTHTSTTATACVILVKPII